MNFHLELRKSSCRKKLKRRTGRSLDILEVRRHELVIGRSPTWAPCHIRYYPAVGRISIHGPAGQYIGWADNLATAIDQIGNDCFATFFMVSNAFFFHFVTRTTHNKFL